MSKKDEVIDIINKMFMLCEPITYGEFNKKMKAIDVIKLREEEKQNEKIGVANYGKEDEGISILSLIATITDVLVDDRLFFMIEESDSSNIDECTIIGVQWFNEFINKGE